jgi:predicted lipid-binding transport protein (Tim44 family)
MARTQTSPEYRPALGQGGGNTDAVAPQSGDDIGLLATDFDAFETRLADVQAAWSKGDLAALRRLATPEMVGYLSEELSANSSRGVENRVEQVKLEQGDLSEAWQEGATQYASVAMRWTAVDYEVSLSDGKLVGGSREERREHIEVWTFMRSQGGDWILSAIQQV